jgi:hypothetical protein
MSGARLRLATHLVAVLLAVTLGGCTAPNPSYSREGPDAELAAPADAAALDLLADTARPDAARDAAAPDLAVPPDAAALDPAGTCPQRADLALCLRFEGAVSDESQYRVALTTQNVTYGTGATGKAADMGATSVISIPDGPLFDVDAVTIEAWFNPRTASHRQGVLDNDGQYGLILLASNTIMCIGVGNALQSAVTGGAVAAGVWTSAACVIDQSANTLYINGVKVATAPRTGPLRTTSSYGITVGADGADGNPFDGLIDNVRVWRTSRTPAEICAGARNCR